MSDIDETEPMFPSQIMLKDLRATHPEYDTDLMTMYSDLYRGGRDFKKNIEKYLDKRADEDETAAEQQARRRFADINPLSKGDAVNWQNELMNGGNAGAACAKAKRAAKIARARYVPLVAGIIDFMLAAIMQNPPAIVASDGKEVEPDGLIDRIKNFFIGMLVAGDITVDDATSYWHRLNTNADGNGASLANVVRAALLEIFLNKRAYFSVRWPDRTAPQGSLFGDQKTAGDLDASICLLGAADVDDWECDEYGNLIYVRTHWTKAVRSSPEKQPDSTYECWTYLTADASYTYKITYQNNQKQPLETMIEGTTTTYSTGFPVIPIRVNDGLWFMERMADPQLALFNRQVSLDWFLDSGAYQILVAKTREALDSIVDSTLGAVRINPEPGAGLEFACPNTNIADALQKNVGMKQEDLFAAFQAMVLVAAAKDQNDRQSGIAKQRDFGALATLMASFAGPLKEALAQAVGQIKVGRKETNLILAVQGLDKFDVQSLELKIANANGIMAMPNIAKTAKRWVSLDTSLAACANAPSPVKEAIVSETLNLDMEDPEPPAPAPFGGRVPPVGAGQKPINEPEKGAA